MYQYKLRTLFLTIIAVAVLIQFMPSFANRAKRDWQVEPPNYKPPNYKYRTDLVKTQYDYQADWPTDPDELCAHMNNTNQLELEAMNEPSRFPDFYVTGESRGQLIRHQEQLFRLGFRLSWNSKTKQYNLVPYDGRIEWWQTNPEFSAHFDELYGPIPEFAE
jgi:hypothetical protein